MEQHDRVQDYTEAIEVNSVVPTLKDMSARDLDPSVTKGVDGCQRFQKHVKKQ